MSAQAALMELVISFRPAQTQPPAVAGAAIMVTVFPTTDVTAVSGSASFPNRW
jgi:hypothetical protein